MLNKIHLTQRILDLAGDQVSTTVDNAMREWWVNFRSGGGMRLTQRGYEIFTAVLELEQWQFELPGQTLVPKNLMLLDKKLSCPYYLRRVRQQYYLHMFGDREAMVATLYGDIEKFLLNLSRQESTGQ